MTTHCDNGMCGECDDCMQDVPAPTMHVRHRCHWRAATGGQCELEPHAADVPHRVTLSDGGVLECKDSRPVVDLAARVQAALTAVEAQGHSLAAWQKATQALYEGLAGKVEALEQATGETAEKVRGLERHANRPQDDRVERDLRGALTRVQEERDALRLECDELTAEEATASDERDTLAEHVKLAVQERDEARKERDTLLALKQGGACRPGTCGYQTLVNERDTARAAQHQAEQSLAAALRERNEAMDVAAQRLKAPTALVHRAYACVELDWVVGQHPRVVGAGIYSEPADSLTTRRGHVFACVHQSAPCASYHEAADEVRRALTAHPDWRWMLEPVSA